MLKKIIGTTGTRILNALFALIILYLITNHIGSTGMGIIGLIILAITIIQIIVDLVAGSALIYYASRIDIGKLLIPAYLWILIVIASFTGLFFAANSIFDASIIEVAVPKGFAIHILLLSLLSGFMVTHYNLLLGKGEIKKYNILFTIQITTMLAAFVYQLFIAKNTTVYAYLTGMYFGFGSAALLGFISIIYKIGKIELSGWKSTTKKVLNYGMITQLANVLNVGNNRLSFYIIRHYTGLSSLGVYNAGVQLTEGLRVIGQSIAVVQFSTISNTNIPEYARTLTIRLMKLSVLLTGFALVVLIAIPENIYTLLLTKDFSGVKPVVIALSPGVMALAINNIFSHYFSGMGNPKINLYAKIAGLAFTIVLVFILIPRYGYIGAAITASISYTVTVIYQYTVFKIQTKTRFTEWLPSRKDFNYFNSIIKSALKKEKL